MRTNDCCDCLSTDRCAEDPAIVAMPSQAPPRAAVMAVAAGTTGVAAPVPSPPPNRPSFVDPAIVSMQRPPAASQVRHLWCSPMYPPLSSPFDCVFFCFRSHLPVWVCVLLILHPLLVMAVRLRRRHLWTRQLSRCTAWSPPVVVAVSLNAVNPRRCAITNTRTRTSRGVPQITATGPISSSRTATPTAAVGAVAEAVAAGASIP